MLEQIKQDLAWAAIERILGRAGFHTELLHTYRDGRWLAGWVGGPPPGGTPIVV